MELRKWNYDYITDLVEFANDKEIAKNLRDNFPILIRSKMLKTLKHFERYIIRLSQKTLFDEHGNAYIHVEEEVKRMLETKLITAILRFDLS